jgi:hypothetical protein
LVRARPEGLSRQPRPGGLAQFASTSLEAWNVRSLLFITVFFFIKQQAAHLLLIKAHLHLLLQTCEIQTNLHLQQNTCSLRKEKKGQTCP